MIAVLAGGSGGAKLARGIQDVVGPEELTVIANTGDDIEIYGVHVSPDPDLIAYWLADLIDPRGWGLAGDSWERMDELERKGKPTWFRLGDRDLELCALRTARLAAGERLTAAHGALLDAVGVRARVLPMSDDPVRTRVGSRPLQEFLILGAGDEPGEVRFEGIEGARPTPEVLASIAEAEAIVIGPSNPIISIGPILALPGMREALATSAAPVVAVSPFVGGRAIKGPTEAFCRAAGVELGAAGIADLYGPLLDGLVADERARPEWPAALTVPTLMDSPEARARVAEATVDFAGSLARGAPARR